METSRPFGFGQKWDIIILCEQNVNGDARQDRDDDNVMLMVMKVLR